MKKSPPSIDWQRLFNKLLYSATAWMIKKRVNKTDPMIKGVGPPDLAQRAIGVIVQKYHHFVDVGSEDDILNLAYRIMWRDFLDLVRSKDYRTKDSLDEIRADQDDFAGGATGATQYQDLADEEAAKDFYELAAGDSELIEYIEAVLEVKVYKREVIAELLGISPQEVTNRQRRLRYKYIARQKKESRTTGK